MGAIAAEQTPQLIERAPGHGTARRNAVHVLQVAKVQIGV